MATCSRVLMVSLCLLLSLLASCVLAQSPPAPVPFVGVGSYIILYSNYSGRYVTVDPTTLQLSVTGTTANSAAVFYVSTNAGDGFSLIYTKNGLFVSAEGGGSQPLVANRPSASRWEGFNFNPRFGTGYYTISSQANQLLVTVQTDSKLIPTSTPQGPGLAAPNTLFLILSPPTVAPTPVPFPVGVGRRIILFSNSTQRWVEVDRFTQQLTATATSPINAAIFNVSTDSGDSVSLFYGLRRVYVSAENAGASPLIANRQGAGTWEAFFFNARVATGYYTITAQINQKLVTVQGTDNLLIATSTPLPFNTPPAQDTLFLVQTPALQ